MPSQARILIVEDEPLIIRALGRMLRDYQVHVVTSVAELILTHDDYDVALCDIGLADGNSLDGLHCVRARRVVLMSGAPPPPLAQQLLLGSTDVRWLAKPFLRDDLLACIAA